MGGRAAPPFISPLPDDTDLVGTSIPRFHIALLTARRSLSSHACVATLEEHPTTRPKASAVGLVPRDSP
jgi:hypothetical protein